MIILDTATKSLTANGIGSSDSGMWVISYWSVDTSNVWTPHSFTGGFSGSNATEVLLAAPTGGKTLVVNNFYFHFLVGTTTTLVRFALKDGGATQFFGEFNALGVAPVGVSFVMDKNGNLSSARTTVPA